MNERSEPFRRFHESFFGSRGYGWEPDTHALCNLEGEERATGEDLLIEALRRGDSEAAYGLRKLGSTKALPALHTALKQPDARLRIQSALALWQLERFPSAARVIIRCMGAKAPSDPVDDEEIDGDLLEFEQIDGVCALGEISTRESADALVAALSHPRDLVRYNAARALARLGGQARDIAARQTQLMSREPAEAAAAREAILAAIDVSGIEDQGPQDFEIYFDPLAHEYLVYAEGNKHFHFHPDYSAKPFTVPTGDYLSGMLGQPRAFAVGERERIIPRLETFLAREKAAFRTSVVRHRPEPSELTPALGGKVRLKAMSSMATTVEEAEASLPRWARVVLLMAGLVLGGGAGLSVGKLLEMLLDMRSPTAWVCSALGAAVGSIAAWLRWRG